MPAFCDTQTTRQRFIGQSRYGKALPSGVKSTFLALCYEEKSGAFVSRRFAWPISSSARPAYWLGQAADHPLKSP